MTLNKKCSYLNKILIVVYASILIAGCASQQKPNGGPRDRTPPQLLKATPLNMTRNFNAKQVRLDFDEFFTLKNQYQEITMSPNPEKLPEYKISKKSIIINFKDSLQKNTTYVINFGKAIADVNEGNILENFTYVFSTGNHIDSLSVNGTVSNILNQEKEKEVTVMLFPLSRDSLFGKKKPNIYATTDTSGNFKLNNLHEGDYRIYALKETSPNKIYDNENELVAFQKNTIHLYSDTNDIKLVLFKQEPKKFRLIDRRFDQDGKMFFTFNKPLNNPSVKILYPPSLDDQKVVDISKTRDTAMVYSRNMDFDSIRVAFLDNNKPVDTISLRKGRKESFTRTITLVYNVNGNNKLQPGIDLIARSNLPIESFDPALITLNEDSVNLSNYTIAKDTGSVKKLRIKYRWKETSNYRIIFNEGAFSTIFGDKNKKILKDFQTDKADNYGTLTFKVTLPDTGKAYVVNLLNTQKKILRSDPLTKNSTLVYKNYPVGKYFVQVIYDRNKNGKWDSGNVKEKIQPENIWLYNKEITLRANWESEEPIAIPKEPVIP